MLRRRPRQKEVIRNASIMSDVGQAIARIFYTAELPNLPKILDFKCKSRLEGTAFRLSTYNIEDLLQQFRAFLSVDLRRSKKTTSYEAVRLVRKFLEGLDSVEVSAGM